MIRILFLIAILAILFIFLSPLLLFGEWITLGQLQICLLLATFLWFATFPLSIKRPLLIGLILLAGLSGASADEVQHRGDFDSLVQHGFRPLFNGKNLDGWQNPGRAGRAEVIDRELHLNSKRKFFLVTQQRFRDFILVADVKLPGKNSNSGINFRSQVQQEKVSGYQAEIDGSPRRWSGGLYEEGGRQWIWPSLEGRSAPEFLTYATTSQQHFQTPMIRDAFRMEDWNRYVIECRGPQINIFVNGVLVTDLADDLHSTGFVALECSGGEGQTFRFRNLFIKELADSPAEKTVHLVEQKPIKIEKVTDDTWLLDFGKVAFGNVVWHQPAESGMDLNRQMTFHFGEKQGGGRIDRQPPGTVRYENVELSLNSGVDLGNGKIRITPIADRRNTEQVSNDHPPAVLTPESWGTIVPFRWLEIEGLTDELADQYLNDVRRQAAFPINWDPDAAHFSCSDETLNRIWELSHYSILATSFAGVYIDGDRERIPYEGDAYLNQLSHYATDNDIQMARSTFNWLMQNGTWPSEWAPHMVFVAHADWLHTGDGEWLQDRYEFLKTKLLLDRVAEDGLVRSNNRQRNWNDLVDWPRRERDNFVHTEINTVINAFHLAAVNHMIVLAKAMGRTEEAEQWQNRFDSTRQKFNEVLFDPQQNIYRDGIGTDHSSLHANLFPLAFGLAPDSAKQRIAQWLVNRGMRCSVYAAQYLMEGLFENGFDRQAIELMLADNDRSWRHMVDSGTTITWEAWDQKYKPNQDWNHAWGAAPANLLPRYILGFKPTAPAWEKIRIRPHLGGLDYAEGKIPTTRGPIDVRWEKSIATTGPQFRMQIALPEGSIGDLQLPLPADYREVRVNDERIEFNVDLATGRTDGLMVQGNVMVEIW